MSSTTPRTSSDETDDRKTRRHIAPLLARRRRNLQPNDAHVSEDKYNYTDTNGDKIYRIDMSHTETGPNTIDVNLSALLGAAPSTTSNVEILRTEAEQAAEATDDELADMNPHIPSTDGVLARATAAIESDGLTPAWEVVH